MIFCKHVHVGCMAKSDLKINDNKIEFSFIIPRSQPLHTRASFAYSIKHVMHMYQSLYRGLARFCHKLRNTIHRIQISNTNFTGMF